MGFNDYCRILGVSEDTSVQDIKKAFRQMALRYHPNRHPVNSTEVEERFKEIMRLVKCLAMSPSIG